MNESKETKQLPDGESPLDTKPWLKDLPNQLTLFRIASIPLLLILFPLDIKPLNLFCAALFTIAALTDWLDGFIARRYNLVTRIGAVLDPVADKMLVAAALVLLAKSGAIYAWMAGLLLCREIGISGLRLVALEKGLTISVSQWGKWKTLALDVGIVCMMVNRPLFGWPWVEVGMISMWIALGLSLYSAWLYSHSFWRKSNI